MNRTKLLIRNVFSGLGSKIISLLLGFASRTVFIMFLGNVYLGVNGLFTNILSVLSFAELGFGIALNFAMYKPIANNDKVLIVQLLDYYKKIYKIIVAIIIVVGCAIIPAIPYLVKDADAISNSELMIFYSLNLFNTVISYFISYKSTYVNACQKGYVITIYDAIINSLIIIVQIVVIVTAKLYMAYIIVHSILLLISKIGLNFYINKKFPIVKEKPQSALPVAAKKEITSNVKGLVLHQFSTIAVFCTDNIIISSMVSVILVGLVSNYNLIITNVVGFLKIIFSSFSAAFGNIYAKESKEVFYSHFSKINFVNFWLYAFCNIAFFVLLPPFINLWIGTGNLIDTPSFALLIICTFLTGIFDCLNNARKVMGNFNIDKWLALVEALVNLVVSVVAAKYLGLLGVYIGTLCSRLFFFISRPVTAFKLLFNTSSSEYYIKTFLQFCAFIIASVFTYFATKYILSINHWGYFILGAIIVLVVSNAVLLLLTFWTKDFKGAVKYVYEHLFKRKKKAEDVRDDSNGDLNVDQSTKQNEKDNSNIAVINEVEDIMSVDNLINEQNLLDTNVETALDKSEVEGSEE